MDRRKQQKKERKLTAAEQKRKEMFLEKKAALEAEGFEAHDLTISAVYANVMALVLALPIVLVLSLIHIWLGNEELFQSSENLFGCHCGCLSGSLRNTRKCGEYNADGNDSRRICNSGAPELGRSEQL